MARGIEGIRLAGWRVRVKKKQTNWSELTKDCRIHLQRPRTSVLARKGRETQRRKDGGGDSIACPPSRLPVREVIIKKMAMHRDLFSVVSEVIVIVFQSLSLCLWV